MNTDYGIIRICCVTPVLQLADIRANAETIVESAIEASENGSDIIVFPEMSLTGYTCADIFHQSLLYGESLKYLEYIAEKTGGSSALIAVGLPVLAEGRIFNCAAALQCGRILGIVPKTYIPNYSEFYERRWFSPGPETGCTSLAIAGSDVPFGTDLLFSTGGSTPVTAGIELCEDMWAPLPPSVRMSLAGADIILNLSASNELAGKARYRRELIEKLSGQQLSVYAYCSSGVFESSTDTVYGGHRIIAENGRLLTENKRFERGTSFSIADADTGFIRHERIQNKTFSDCAALESPRNGMSASFRRVPLAPFASGKPEKPSELQRFVDSRPFVPSAVESLHKRCSEIFSIQSAGLASRLKHIGSSRVVIGLSGGLDSTLALLVCIEAFRSIGLSEEGIICITMPGFGTTGRTRGNAEKLCLALGLKLETVSIEDAVNIHFRDIGHDSSVHDVTFENSQARERTQILMDLANRAGGIVIGTGDLSEQAMGWSTYNGDHMSMYAVNTGVPKTLVRFLVEYYIDNIATPEAAEVLKDICATPISPELLPPDENGEIMQKTEEKIGPYELHDFFLYQTVRCGHEPSKVLFLAEAAFSGENGSRTYGRDEIRKWLRLFYTRFFSQQFKRSCVPDGPKVGTIALSPRADWRMPSDASSELWLEQLED